MNKTSNLKTYWYHLHCFKNEEKIQVSEIVGFNNLVCEDQVKLYLAIYTEFISGSSSHSG